MRKKIKTFSQPVLQVKANEKKRKNRTAFLFFVLVTIIGTGRVYAQKIDSLKSVLPKKFGLDRCDVFNALATEYIDTDNQMALQYAGAAFNMGYSYGDSLRLVRAGRISAMALRRLGKLDSSLSVSFRILPIAERNNFVDELKIVLHGIGWSYTYMADYDKALRYDLRSLDLRERYGTKVEISASLHNIGYVFYRLKDYDMALSYFERALKLKAELKDVLDLDLMFLNISLCYAYKQNFEKAKELLSEAFVNCSGSCSPLFLTSAEFSYGVISLGENRIADAELHFKKSYIDAVTNNDERFQLDNIIYLVNIYMEDDRLSLAKRYLQKAEKLIKSGTPYKLELVKVYDEFINLFERSSNFEMVAEYQRKYILLKESIYTDALTRNLIRVEAEYAERENRSRIEAQNKILLLNEKIIYRQRFLNFFIGVITLLSIFLALILFKNNRQRKQANLLLEQRVRERTAELETNRNVLERSLEERDVHTRKISRDMKQGLATIKGLCSLGLKDPDRSVFGEYLAKIDQTSEQLLTMIRRTAVGE